MMVAVAALSASCQTGGIHAHSGLLAETGPCPSVKTFTLAPPPGKIPGEDVTADGSGLRGRVVTGERTLYFRYCPDKDMLHSVTKLVDQGGDLALENSLSPRFSSVIGVTEAFAEGQFQGLRIVLESRNLKIEGATVSGNPVVFVAEINAGPFSQFAIVGQPVPVVAMPRPPTDQKEPLTRSSFLTCDAGSEVHSFSSSNIVRGDDEIQLQFDVCLADENTVSKSALLQVIKSQWNGQTQTDLIQIPATKQSGAENLIFGNISEATQLEFKSEKPLGRHVISKLSLSGGSDGVLVFSIDDVIVGPVSLEFGPLSAPDGCLPGETLVRSSLKFGAASGLVTVKMVACQIFQFGATGTMTYYFKEIEVLDQDSRVANASRTLTGEELKTHSRLAVSHHNSCDKLEIQFDDVQYGFTSPVTFSIGNDCEDDVGIAPPNPSSDTLAIRKRLTSGNITELFTIPWGKGLTYSPTFVLSPQSDPLE